MKAKERMRKIEKKHEKKEHKLDKKKKDPY
jgi:hypothetical protein